MTSGPPVADLGAEAAERPGTRRPAGPGRWPGSPAHLLDCLAVPGRRGTRARSPGVNGCTSLPLTLPQVSDDQTFAAPCLMYSSCWSAPTSRLQVRVPSVLDPAAGSPIVAPRADRRRVGHRGDRASRRRCTSRRRAAARRRGARRGVGRRPGAAPGSARCAGGSLGAGSEDRDGRRRERRPPAGAAGCRSAPATVADGACASPPEQDCTISTMMTSTAARARSPDAASRRRRAGGQPSVA